MMNTNAQSLIAVLAKLPGVESVNEIKIKDKIIEHISIENKSIGRLMVNRLNVEDASALFDFYFRGLSEESRNFWPPYPLFSPPVNSVEELANRIMDWEKEDDWTFLKLLKGELIIGVCFLKRYRTELPRFGEAVRKEYENLGLGLLLLTLVKEQARLLGLKNLVATIAPENIASIQMHKWCGFKNTGQSVPHYVYKGSARVIDRTDIQMIVEL